MQRRIVTLVATLSLAWTATAGELAKTTLSVEGLGCPRYTAAFERQLAAIEGVTDYVVTARKGQAAVTYDPDKTDAGTIGEALLGKGYQVRLAPWEPVDASFDGCSNGWCGSRRPDARVSRQPGAAPGDDVYCPVSGVVLRIKGSTPRTDLGGKTLYVCCDGCLRYFNANRGRVLALRGAKSSGRLDPHRSARVTAR